MSRLGHAGSTGARPSGAGRDVRFVDLCLERVHGGLYLARLERATGHKDRAVALIEGVIKDDPTSPDAKTLLGEMRGQKLALSQ